MKYNVLCTVEGNALNCCLVELTFQRDLGNGSTLAVKVNVSESKTLVAKFFAAITSVLWSFPCLSSLSIVFCTP